MASHRRTLAAALAVIAASVSLYPIFMGAGWFWAGVGSVVVVAAAGTATRLRRLPVAVCLGGGLLALLLYLNLAFASARSLYHVLPTPRSMSFIWHLAGQGFTEASKYAPPVPELRGMLLLAAAGVGIAALLTDLIAVRLESAALAGLPLLLLFTEPFTLSVSRGPVGTTVAFIFGVAGYLALLSSEARDRIREWEQANPDPRMAPNTQALAAAGRRVGFASVVLALILPVIIPGLHTTRLFGGQPGIGGTGGLAIGFPDPNTQLSTELREARPSLVLQYRTTATSPDYFQVYVLDKLSDSGWQLFARPESMTSATPKLPPAPGLTATGWGTEVHTSVKLAPDLGQAPLDALPVPYPATAIQVPGTARAERNTLMVVDDSVALANLSYSVTSLDEAPPAQLLSAAGLPPADITNHYLAVPASYQPLHALAVRVASAANANTQLQDAIALQEWLSGGDFTYTLNAPTVTDAKSMTTFLERTKRGYCEQFAFSMAVLARLLGIPSRLAYGYTAGSFVTAGHWAVTTHDAHAWPELYFAGFGWLRFEPTPGGTDGQGTATTPSYTYGLPNTHVQAPGQTGSNPTSPAGSNGSTLNKGALSHQLGLEFGHSGGLGGDTAGGGGSVNPWEVFGLVLAGLALLALAAPGTARLAVRQRRWRLARSSGARRAGGRAGSARAGTARAGTARDAALAHAAWRELRDDLVDHGAGYLPSESPRAVAARATSVLQLPAPAAGALRRIALAEERARYAAEPTDGSGLHGDSVAVRRAIGTATGRRARWRARLLPSSVVGPALAGMSQAADLFGRISPEWLGWSRLPLAGRAQRGPVGDGAADSAPGDGGTIVRREGRRAERVGR
jgi:transglutaminase-like putative cysteine protease